MPFVPNGVHKMKSTFVATRETNHCFENVHEIHLLRTGATLNVSAFFFAQNSRDNKEQIRFIGLFDLKIAVPFCLFNSSSH